MAATVVESSMENEALRQAVAEMLRETAEAHQRALVPVPGEEIDWPYWYAKSIVLRLNRALSKEWDEQDLARLLMEAERRRMDEGAEDWADYYANFLAEQP